MSTRSLAVIALLFLAGLFVTPFWGQGADAAGPAATPAAVTVGAEAAHHFQMFALFKDAKYSSLERFALIAVLGIAVVGLLYAVMLVKQVVNADKGTLDWACAGHELPIIYHPAGDRFASLRGSEIPLFHPQVGLHVRNPGQCQWPRLAGMRGDAPCHRRR